MRHLFKKNHRVFYRFGAIVFIGFLIYLLQRAASASPDLVETYYSRGIAPHLSRLLSLIVRWFPASLGEGILYAHVLFGIYLLLLALGHVLKMRWRIVGTGLLKVTAYFIMLYCVFMLVWGFHYLRPDLSERMGLSTEPRQLQALESLAKSLIDEAKRNQQVIVRSPEKLQNMAIIDMIVSEDTKNFASSDLGQQMGLISGALSLPKGVLLSEGMSYLGITGIYMPFTGEANINMHVPALLIPATMAHELAHQRGIAPEDEANFVAYLVTGQSKNATVRYSGSMLALIYTMNQLHEKAPEKARVLREQYSPEMRADLKALSGYWKKYEGEISQSQEKVNDAYLKFNQQVSGTASYGEMVDLLLAYKAQGKK